MTEPRILSTVFDTNNHTIERLATPPNALRIRPTKGTRPIEQADAQAAANWFWSHVGLKDGEPLTLPIGPDDTTETVS